jgi:hypothetical protein
MDDDLIKPTKMKEPEWLRKALASTSGMPFFIANRAVHPAGDVRIPDHMLERWSREYAGEAPLVITTIAAIDAIDLPLTPYRKNFLDGEVVPIWPHVVEQVAERNWGGQRVDGLEKRARDGLRIMVVLATETVRGCLDRDENTKGDLEERRIFISTEMEPFLAGLAAINCFREGQALLPHWFPGRKAHAVMMDAYAKAANAPRLTNAACFTRIRAEQMQLVRAAGMIYAKALRYQRAQHDMSAEMRAMQRLAQDAGISEAASQMQETSEGVSNEQRLSAPVWQELAHARHDSPTIDEFMATSIMMDLNPADIFANVASFAKEFACASLLGRAARGHEVRLSPIHCERLQAFMARADEADLEPELANETDKAAQRLRDLALTVNTRSGWDAFFAIAKASNKPLKVPPVSRP